MSACRNSEEPAAKRVSKSSRGGEGTRDLGALEPGFVSLISYHLDGAGESSDGALG